MNKNILISILFVFFGCTIQQKNISKRNYEYVNDNKLAIKLDSATIKDKYFKINLPDTLLKKSVNVNSTFQHILSFIDNQQIMIIYVPEKNDRKEYKRYNISYEEFLKTTEGDKYLPDFQNTVPIINRRFGVNKIKGIGFYLLYLNVKLNCVDDFNRSISNMQF